ncbi:hypothetical protein [Limnospira platensis]|uniref:hypothetical protein n=1 Tax=Limnospira platensis TaxID=118562 RepID=UPI0021A99CF3|nr:hypothetical protein APLC1_5599 [Arthrospira platensis C1]
MPIVIGTELLPPALSFFVQSYMQHVVFQLALAVILLLITGFTSTPWHVCLSLLLHKAFASCNISIPLGVGVEREVAFPNSHSKPCLIVSHHTAPDVDTLFVKGTELLPPALSFFVQSYMQHVVFQLALAVILLLITGFTSTPWHVCLSLLLHKAFASCNISIPLGVGVESEVAFPNSHSKPCLIVSHHTAPDVDTLFVIGTELLPPALSFFVQSYMQHVVFQLALAVILLLITGFTSTPWHVCLSLLLHKAFASCNISIPLGVGVESEVAFPNSHSKPCLIVSHHTAPDVDTLFVIGTELLPLLCPSLFRAICNT